jgi:hypothetical protein
VRGDHDPVELGDVAAHVADLHAVGMPGDVGDAAVSPDVGKQRREAFDVRTRAAHDGVPLR